MNIQHNDALVEKLAAEYVLGTLKGGARRRFESLMRDHGVLQRAVVEWQDRLHPMAEFASSEQVPPHVWNRIATQLDIKPEKARGRFAFWQGLRNDLGFWRGLGMSSTALAAILVAVLVARQPEITPPGASYVAMLADDKSQPMAVVTGDTGRGQMTFKIVTAQPVAPDKSLELWAVPKEGPPRSLGVVADNGTVTMPMPENMTPQAIPLLAVTLEPKGGSPNPNGPTGPIVFKGAWVQI
jgi:anti-sigma-K factor RskA